MLSFSVIFLLFIAVFVNIIDLIVINCKFVTIFVYDNLSIKI